MASTAAHGPPVPIPWQRACFLHHGQLQVLLVCYGSSRGGALPNFYLGNFKGFFAATSWAAAMDSIAAGSPPAPIPGQRAYCPHHGQLQDLSGGGGSTQFLPVQF
jgi:hypothetical protein